MSASYDAECKGKKVFLNFQTFAGIFVIFVGYGRFSIRQGYRAIRAGYRRISVGYWKRRNKLTE